MSLLREFTTNVVRGAIRWGVPMFAVSGIWFYLRTQSIVGQGAPPDTVQKFWWPFVPALLLWFLVLGALIGVSVSLMTRLISARRRTVV
jgi:hypothetical protein